MSPHSPSNREPQIFLHWVSRIPQLSGKSRLIYESPNRTPKGGTALWVEERAGGALLFSFPAGGRFLLREHEVWCETGSPADRSITEEYLLSTVLPFLLETRGRIVLHGSGVRMGEEAVGFLAHSGGGKSTLAANLVQFGWPFVTDDLLVIERLGNQWVVHTGPPEVRLWPEMADQFVSDGLNLKEVAESCGKRRFELREVNWTQRGPFRLQLGHLYLPARQPGAPHMSPVPPRDAIIELVRYSFLARLTDAMGIACERLEKLAAIAEEVPLARLYYDSGFDEVDRLTAVLEGACNSTE